MKARALNKALPVGLAALALACTLMLAACAPSGGEQTAEPSQPESNDSAQKGDYTPYDPEAEAEITAGKAIEGSEEEELQQERIAGGAVGGVTSENLEPIEGITDYTDREYVPAYGINGQPPVMGHGDNGADCLSCHKDGGAGAQQPPSHATADLENEECASCHKAP
ncbi:hypothetical protein [Raoultibacter phocaeensis]|uniref:hypothetical protein n=1 Tax=Raoultibacter phocaeensis TaxID=2479841 RepID=UPI0011188E4D|nr:hypothetical protein [Raoultibacter phocaeensis]